MLEKMRLLSRATIQGCGETSICRGVSRSQWFRQEQELKGDDCGHSPRIIHDKKSIYICMCLHMTLAIV
jgi:hypothetical protein